MTDGDALNLCDMAAVLQKYVVHGVTSKRRLGGFIRNLNKQLSKQYLGFACTAPILPYHQQTVQAAIVAQGTPLFLREYACLIALL